MKLPSNVSVELVEPQLFASVVAEEVAASVRDALAERGTCSLVLAGGTSPGAVYRALSRPPYSTEIDWRKVVLLLGDERWDPTEEQPSNAAMVEENWLSQLTQNRPQTCFVNLAEPSIGKAVEDYNQRVKLQLKNREVANSVVDLAILGMGEDGHIASIFPGSAVWTEREGLGEALAAQVKFESRGTWRITLTPSLFINARRLLFLVTGSSKATTIAKVLETPDKFRELPASIFLEAKGSVTWFVDSAAGVKLRESGTY